MGHRNILNTPQIVETESYQGQNNTEQPYMLIGRAAASESSSLVHPVQNRSVNGGPFPPPRPPAAPGPTINYSSIPPVELPCFQQHTPGPSRDPFLHQPTGGNVHMVDCYSRPPSSSSLIGQSVPGGHVGFVDPTATTSSRGYKRKSPSIPQLYDRGSSSRSYDVGSSSNFILPNDPWQEKQNTESYQMPWEYSFGYRVNSLSIGGEGMQRNVRSRTVMNQDPNLARAPMPNNPVHHSLSNQPSDGSSLQDYSGQTNVTVDWNHCFTPPVGHGGSLGADSSSISHSPNTVNPLNNQAIGSVENGDYNNNASIAQNNYGYLNQPHRQVQSSYDQRSAPTFRSPSNTFYQGQVVASGEDQVMAAENFPSGYSQAFPTTGFRYNERNGRAGISRDRYRYFAGQSSVPGRIPIEDMMAANYHMHQGLRPLFDQHRDMRLDIDNMSYEELLALGERIGSVNTGLSDSLISRCLTRSLYHSSDQFQDSALCVICLEEYKMHMDEVGTLKCGHDFHVGCITKWLAMKNLCPICKAPAVDDKFKEELSS